MRIPTQLVEALNLEEDVAVIVDAEGVIRFVNDAWASHAASDGAAVLTADVVLGRPYLSFIQGPLRAELARCLEGAVADRHRTGITLHSECNTPSTFRRLSTHFSAVRTPEGELLGVVIRQSLRAEGPLSERHEIADRAPETYRNDSGLIVQCSCCRRVREPDTDRWTLCLPLLNAAGISMSHGLCASCLEVYFSEGDDGDSTP